jgi:hypothetical protein
MMQFESLANELLLDLFELFDTAQLLRAFTGLNNRFNQLLCYHFRVHQFNLQFLSKEDFDNISEKYLPLIIDQIISLRLSNNETLDLPELLLYRGFTLNRFIRLQSLSLFNIYSLDTLDKIIYQCRYLPHFTHLNIIKYDEGEIYKNIVGLLNNIWSLKKLIYCNLNGIIHADEISLSKISTISSSIEYLSIENIPCNLNSLSHLFKCTPHLQRFYTTLYSYSLNDHLTFVMSSIKTIKFFFGGSFDSIKNLIEKLPNLSHLMVITSQIYLDGNIWKELIKNYLPKMKIFQLKMEFDFQGRNDDMEDITNELLESFRNSFWIEEHQVYVRCHWNPSDPFKSITLYTLPYAFDTFDSTNTCCTKSTCLDQQQYWSYDCVQIFGHSNIDNTLLDSFSLLRARFPNIHHLYINLPFDDIFWLRFTSLNHLKSLNVFLYKYSSYCQLQTLFDQAPCLYSLKITSFLGLSPKIFDLTSKSIRRIDFIDISVDQSIYFNKDDCFTLINSSLGIQCEVLLIRIKNRTIIFDLIVKLLNLRLLIFECEDDKESFLNYSFSKNELIPWLQHHLPSTYSIIRDRKKLSRIQIWIDREITKKFSSNNFTLISKHKNKLSQILTSFRQFFS